MPSASRVQNFRSSVQSEAKKSKGKGFRGGYRDRLDIPKAAPTPILITPGDYEDLRPDEIKQNGGVPPKKHYHTRPEHGIKVNDNMYRSGTCIAGYDGKEDCLCCLRKQDGDNRINLRDKYSVNVLHFGLFRQEQLMKDGKPVRYEKDGKNHKRGEPVKGWVEVTRTGDVKDLRARLRNGEQMDDVCVVRKKFLDVGRGHLGNVMQIAELAEKLCWCGGNLTPYEFHCANPECDATLCNVEQENLTVEEVVRYAQERVRCGSCGLFELPLQRAMCDTCTDPRALTIFDVVAYVRRQGEGTASTVLVEKIVPVHQFVAEDGYGILAEEAFTEVEGQLIPQFNEVLTKLMPQFDFDTVHMPQKNDDTAALLKCDNPFRKGGRDYSQYRKGAEDEPAEDAPAEQAEERRRPVPVRRTPVRG